MWCRDMQYIFFFFHGNVSCFQKCSNKPNKLLIVQTFECSRNEPKNQVAALLVFHIN